MINKNFVEEYKFGSVMLDYCCSVGKGYFVFYINGYPVVPGEIERYLDQTINKLEQWKEFSRKMIEEGEPDGDKATETDG